MTSLSYGSRRGLEAEGYTVFADILSLGAGRRAGERKSPTHFRRAASKCYCAAATARSPAKACRRKSASPCDLVKQLKDPKFIIPLRLEPYKKLLGIGELQYVDFVRGWAEGLDKLLDTSKRQKVPCDPSKIPINPNWEIYRRRGAVPNQERAGATDLKLAARRRSAGCHPIF